MARPLYNAQTQVSAFWNPHIETMPRDDLDRLHLRRLQNLIAYAYDRVPFYRRLMDQHHVAPSDIKTMDDFVNRLPTIDKIDLLEAQATSPPYGDALALPEAHTFHRFATSGSTGVPMQIPLSHYGCVLWGESWGPGLWAIGLRPESSFYFPFNFGIFAAFWSAYMGVSRLGGTMISGGGLDTAGRIKQILDYQPQVMFATPTYALYFGEAAKQLGVDLRQTSIEWVIVAGEPGGSIPTTREAIRDLWDADVHDLYGVAELGHTHYGCPDGGGLHLYEGLYHSLVVDESGQPVADGEVGENIMTSYVQHMQPLIKYRTHDLVRWYARPCTCGRTARFYEGGILGRSDHMLTVRGTNVYPTAVEALLSAVPELSEHYEIHASLQHNVDAVEVKVEARPEVDDTRYAELEQRLATVLHETIKVRIGVNVVASSTLPRYELKAKRFFDHRPSGRGWQIR